MAPKRQQPYVRAVLALSSAALQVVAFPGFDFSWCAWFALVPWLILLQGAAPASAFRWSWLVGFLFFLGSMWWLVFVTALGWIALSAYLALFFAVFGAVVAATSAVGRGSRLSSAQAAPSALAWSFPAGSGSRSSTAAAICSRASAGTCSRIPRRPGCPSSSWRM
jgi:apolipoprotein N-acyltransferase